MHSLMNTCRVSQSVFYQVLNAASDGVILKIFDGEIIFHLKRIDNEKHRWTSGFYRYENTCSYRRQEFQNITERRLWFMQSLWTVFTLYIY